MRFIVALRHDSAHELSDKMYRINRKALTYKIMTVIKGNVDGYSIKVPM